MRPNLRLVLCVVIIIGSVVYGVLVSTDPTIAEALAVGYVAVLLTILTALNVWKRP